MDEKTNENKTNKKNLIPIILGILLIISLSFNILNSVEINEQNKFISEQKEYNEINDKYWDAQEEINRKIYNVFELIIK